MLKYVWKNISIFMETDFCYLVYFPGSAERKYVECVFVN